MSHSARLFSVYNSPEQAALKDFSENRLTYEMILNHKKGGSGFEESHYDALKLLIRKGFRIEAALAEIYGLSKYQVSGIAWGLARADVKDLSGFYQIKTLAEFKDYGLTAEMLLKRKDGGFTFDGDHYWALRFLVYTKKYAIAAALVEIEGLSSNQAMGIKEGLSREDVVDVFNFWHVIALTELKEKGLTGKMLLKLNTGGLNFESAHQVVLCDLVLKKNLTLDAALAKIDGLKDYQVLGIGEGLTRDDVVDLCDYAEMRVLEKLKKHGVSAKMLLVLKSIKSSYCMDLFFAFGDDMRTAGNLPAPSIFKKVVGFGLSHLREMTEGSPANSVTLRR